MTPAERAVIDAARALVPVAAEVSNMARPCSAAERFEIVLSAAHLARFDGLINDLQRAVRALPRPLSEQLAELRPGAVLEDVDGRRLVLLADIAKFREFACEPVDENGNNPSGLWVSINHSDVARVISNPEASDGR